MKLQLFQITSLSKFLTVCEIRAGEIGKITPSANSYNVQNLKKYAITAINFLELCLKVYTF